MTLDEPQHQLAPLGDARIFPGCETELFVPQVRSNQDCTLCLNCVRAYPHDNVALVLRPPTRALAGWRPRTDVALLGTLLLFAGMANALAMTPPYAAAAQWLAAGLGTRREALVLGIMLGGVLGGGSGLTLALFGCRAASPDGARGCGRRPAAGG